VIGIPNGECRRSVGDNLAGGADGHQITEGARRDQHQQHRDADEDPEVHPGRHATEVVADLPSHDRGEGDHAETGILMAAK
jgi:hypothetical protein